MQIIPPTQSIRNNNIYLHSHNTRSTAVAARMVAVALSNGDDAAAAAASPSDPFTATATSTATAAAGRSSSTPGGGGGKGLLDIELSHMGSWVQTQVEDDNDWQGGSFPHISEKEAVLKEKRNGKDDGGGGDGYGYEAVEKSRDGVVGNQKVLGTCTSTTHGARDGHDNGGGDDVVFIYSGSSQVENFLSWFSLASKELMKLESLQGSIPPIKHSKSPPSQVCDAISYVHTFAGTVRAKPSPFPFTPSIVIERKDMSES
ncbi:uncharacterized protein BKCO1_900043 [Diplodia corticola]|uniref:Uncharacterized protein n=1 Tax=Diplodia corticola TaxID=236234 RepID=A0A1J9S8Q1_9PEZI|nr:uncharacterized protein BKCO1_900043 [Diplodia corticola]OJD36887.1 hypothetical protein BKCO1_900043 [Diplodia corticola]